MRGSFEVAASPRFCFLGFLLRVAFFFFFCIHLLHPSLCRDNRATLFRYRSQSLLQVSPFGIRLFHGGSPSCLSPSFFLLLPLSTYPSIRCTQASRPFLLLPPRRPYVPHSCGIASGRASFYNPVPVSEGADLRRCSPTLCHVKTLFVTSLVGVDKFLFYYRSHNYW